MRAIIQRVARAAVSVDNKVVGNIGQGILAYICMESKDSHKECVWMSNKLITLRIFNDEHDTLNKSMKDVSGGILFISNVTLFAKVKKGTRPSVSTGIAYEEAYTKYCDFLEVCQREIDKINVLQPKHLHIASGKFGKDMRIDSVADGPITLLIDTP